MKNVRIIPPKPKENKKLRVAAYCRVSTSGPEQMRSLEIQIKTYSEMIKSHPNWIFADVFYLSKNIETVLGTEFDMDCCISIRMEMTFPLNEAASYFNPFTKKDVCPFLKSRESV